MRDFNGYTIVKVSASIDEKKLQKAVRNGKFTLKADELKGNKPLLVHPTNGALILRAQKKERGITSMMFSTDDIIRDLELHGAKSIWSWLEGYKKRKAYEWIFQGQE